MTLTSFLVPAVGLLTAPILARALGTTGRGELATALAPAYLILPVATLGLPEALTYHLARRPDITRRALGWGVFASTVLGAGFLALTIWAAPFLSGGDQALAGLIVFATVWTVPALSVGVFRGAAIGRQMWGAVAVERTLTVATRLGGLLALWLTGTLTVFTAVLVNVVAPLLAGLPYLSLLRRPPARPPDMPRLEVRRVAVVLTGYGSRIWLGAVASMLLSRIGQVLITPLSDADQTGLYAVATTISDLPLIMALAIQGALFGVNAKTGNPAQVTRTSVIALMLGALGCTAIAVTLPLWIEPLFGTEFAGALVPTLILLVSALICIPGLMAAAGLSSSGRPELRSIGLIAALVVNVGILVATVPALGVYGACLASIAGNVVLTGIMVFAASRVLSVRASSFVLPRRSDLAMLVGEIHRLAARRPRRRSADREDHRPGTAG